MFLNNINGVESANTHVVNMDTIQQHDVIIFQRSNQEKFVDIFKAIQQDPNKLLVYEADDAFDLILNDSYAKPFFDHKTIERMEDLMRLSDVLQLSTPYLCDHYHKRTGRGTYLVPNQIAQIYPHQHHDTDRVIIGWAGGASHNVDFGMIKKPLMNIAKEFPQVTFRIMGASNVFAMLKKWGLPNLEYVDWSKDLNVYYQTLATFDIGLAPVVECGFNKAKSTLKFLEYGACRTPMIGSRFLYERDAVHGETAMLADRSLEWYEMMKDLILDKQKREAIGYAAQDYVAAERMHAHHIQDRVAFYQRALAIKKETLGSQAS